MMRRVQKKMERTPDEQARIRAIREKYRSRPSYEELVAGGDLSGQPLPLGDYLQLKALLFELKKARQAASMTLAEVSEKSGMDVAMLSRLENGRVPNVGIVTITRYMRALGKDIQVRLVDVAGEK